MSPNYSTTNKRMKYDPEYHDKHCQKWAIDDIIYLCKMYETTSKEDLSMALGRTHGTILSKVYLLRKNGKYDYYKNLDEDSL